MTEILRTIYAECMNVHPLAIHGQYPQVSSFILVRSIPDLIALFWFFKMRKMLIEWLIEGGE